uniref:Uncharacterized protein n=1 Tax=Moniliophthora roreri TaxID=221103 RepID=A0A0W0FEU8_MONRR
MHKGNSGCLGKRSHVSDGNGHIYLLNEFVGSDSQYKFRLHAIPPGSLSVPIVDSDDTADVVVSTAKALKKACPEIWFKKKCKSHKHGYFPVQPYGYSYEGGQQCPKSIYHIKKNIMAFKNLTNLSCFKHLAGHASTAFATWAPELYSLYCDYDRCLHKQHPNLTSNFSNSIWACVMYNFGPNTVTIQHVNQLNYIFGWCAITALDNFNYTKSGHIVLWELELVLEFPPSWTILILSAYIHHSNTPISNGKA